MLENGEVYPHILDLQANLIFAKLLLSLKGSLKQQVHRLSDVLSGQLPINFISSCVVKE